MLQPSGAAHELHRNCLAPLPARQDLVLLPNATTGLNVVITSVVGRLKPGDTVYSLDIGWVYSLDIGWVYSLDIGWVYSLDIGWVYSLDIGWVYSLDIGWVGAACS